MNMFASMGGSACIILTENMRYAGIVSAASLIKVINEKQLKMAQDQNPLTALPGNRAIGGFIVDSCSDGDETVSSVIATSTISNLSTTNMASTPATTRSPCSRP